MGVSLGDRVETKTRNSLGEDPKESRPLGIHIPLFPCLPVLSCKMRRISCRQRGHDAVCPARVMWGLPSVSSLQPLIASPPGSLAQADWPGSLQRGAPEGARNWCPRKTATLPSQPGIPKDILGAARTTSGGDEGPKCSGS